MLQAASSVKFMEHYNDMLVVAPEIPDHEIVPWRDIALKSY